MPARREPRSVEDWGIVALIVGFLLVMPFPHLSTGALNWFLSTVHPSSVTYQRAVVDAAIKRPEFKTDDLLTFDSSMSVIEVGTFARADRPQPESPLKRATWVFVPEQLAEKCRGAANATTAIRQILGLPPESEERVIYKMKVSRRDLFRPCMSGSDLSSKSCDFSGPPRPDADASYPTLTADQKVEAWQGAYADLWFMVDHLSKTYSTGLSYGAYPFSGMGWSYDWRPFQKSHIGVSEFVIRKKAAVTILPAIKPQDFCAAPK